MASSEHNQFILGNYQLIEVLGIGAMGYVYRARQLNLDRDVAVKVLSPSLARETGYVDLYLREARTAASLEHAHIVPVIDYGVQQDISYVVMRLLLGGSLGDRIKWRLDHQMPLPNLSEINRIVTQVASALDYAHARGVIHRDIKPNNLMFDQHGAVYIVDFGIAKLIGTTSSIKGSTFLGTPSYMAPEQWQGLSPTPAVDQYAFGAVVYMMITGHPPFESEIALALMTKHLHETPADVQKYCSNAPDQINGVLQQAMAKSPEDRFPNNMAFAQAFTAAVWDVGDEAATEFTTFPLPPMSFSLPFTPVSTSPTPIPQAAPAASTSTPPPTPARRRNLAFWIQSGFVFLLAAALIILLVSRQPDTAVVTPTQDAQAAGNVITPTSSPAPTDEAVQPDSGDGAGETRSSDGSIPLSTVPAQTPSPESTDTGTPTQADAHLVPNVAASFTSLPTSTTLPSVTPTFTASPLPTDTPTLTATSTRVPSSTPTPTFTPSDTPTNTPSNTATPTLIPSDTPSTTPSSTPTPTASPLPTDTPTFTATPTRTPSSTPTFTATRTPSETPSSTPTATPTATPSPTASVLAPRPTVNWHAGSELKVSNLNGVWLRTRPSTRAAQVATLAYNNPVTATGNRQYDGRQWWWEVTAEWGAVGWVEQFSLVQR